MGCSLIISILFVLLIVRLMKHAIQDPFLPRTDHWHHSMRMQIYYKNLYILGITKAMD